ncbi:MAG: hypothetical protein L3J43_02920 [Sulfurovum sp.]|nr:hypothetical protein [Sulfurovum sp.]
MKYTVIHKTLILTSALILVSGCMKRELPADKGGFTYSGIYFGAHFPGVFKKGIKDGCQTSKGVYTKSHWSFKNRQKYADGWFLGRSKCKDLLKIDEDGDLIL